MMLRSFNSLQAQSDLTLTERTKIARNVRIHVQRFIKTQCKLGRKKNQAKIKHSQVLIVKPKGIIRKSI